MEQLKDVVNGYVPEACKLTVDAVFTDQEKLYLPVLKRKCREFQMSPATQAMSHDEKEGLYDKCCNSAGVLLNERSSQDKADYVQQCVDTVGNISLTDTRTIDGKIDAFKKQVGKALAGVFGDDMDKKLGDEIGKIAEEAGIDLDAGGAEGDDDEDEAPSDASEDEKSTESADSSTSEDPETSESATNSSSEDNSRLAELIMRVKTRQPSFAGAAVGCIAMLMFVGVGGFVATRPRGDVDGLAGLVATESEGEGVEA